MYVGLSFLLVHLFSCSSFFAHIIYDMKCPIYNMCRDACGVLVYKRKQSENKECPDGLGKKTITKNIVTYDPLI